MGEHLMFDEIKEECGVFGIYSKKQENLAYITSIGLSGLQQRGEESCRNSRKYRWCNIISQRSRSSIRSIYKWGFR